MDYYVYEHWRLDTNRPFYVGKGSGFRAKDTHSRSKYYLNVVNKVGRENVLIKFVAKNLEENEAFSLEKERILLWRSMGIGLVNFSDGGEGGCSGITRSSETRAKISVASRGRIFSEETRKKMSMAKRGKPRSSETRKKMSESRKKYWDALKNASR